SPGDVVRFTTSTAAPAHLAVIGVDAAGEASVYFPPRGADDAIPAGDGVALPRGTELDATLGPEAVLAVFCARPIHRGALEGLRAAPRGRPRAQAAMPATTMPGCTVDRLSWVKVPAP